MAKGERVISQYFILFLLSINVNVSEGRSGFVSKHLQENQHKSPLIVIINGQPKGLNYHSLKNYDPLRSFDGKHVLAGGPHDKIDVKKSVQIVKDIIKSTGNKNDPAVIQINEKFKAALRTQCESYVECTIKCEVKIKKKKENCEKSCKAIFDYLMICHPPGGKMKPKKPKDSCESEEECRPKPNKWGKTLPPAW